MNTLFVVFKFLFFPLYHRLLKGEGGLILFNVIHAYFLFNFSNAFFLDSAISAIVMCALYGLNDYKDRQADMLNPKKDTSFVASIIQHKNLFLFANISISILPILLSLVWFSYEKSVLILLLLIVNWLYSYKFKAIPGIDIIAVIIWGGLFISIAGEINLQFFFIVGIMTGIAHIYQTMTDKDADSKAAIRTTVVALPQLHTAIIFFYCFLLGALLYIYINWMWAISCLIPLAVYMITRNISLSWYVSRFYFLICWAQLLKLQYESL